MPGSARRLYLPERDRSFWMAVPESDVALRYLAWGYRDFERHPVPASRHDGWVCVMVQEGAPTMRLNGRDIRLPAGTLACVGPDCGFGWTGATVGPVKFLLWMWREPPAALSDGEPRSCIRMHLLTRGARRPLTVVHDLCRREVLRPSGPDARYLDGCQQIFDRTVERAFDAASDGTPPQASEIVGLAQAWLEAHLDSREPIARLCDYLDVSQSTLYRVFRDAHGTSPLAWFQEARMRRAHDMLSAQGRSVKETAIALGYEHANDLSRAYRRHFGCRPTEARPVVRD